MQNTDSFDPLPPNRESIVQSTSKVSKIYSAPKRFDIATIMVVTIAYAFLFMLMSIASQMDDAISIWSSVYIGTFLAIIAIAQIVLFQGERPRLASMAAGSILFPFITLSSMIFYWQQNKILDVIALFLLQGFFVGVPVGYLAGATVGGVFLIADVVRVKILNRWQNSLDNGDEDPW